MITRIQVMLLVLLVALGGYASAAWWIGLSTEQRLQQNEEQLLSSYSYLTLVARDYRRGVFSSTEDVTYGLSGSMSRLLPTSPHGVALSSLRLTIHHSIHHGPLPQLRRVAFATIDSELQLPPSWQRQVSTMLHGQPPIQLHTTLLLSGKSVSVLQSPAFQYQLPDGTLLVWRGLSGTVNATGAMDSWSGNMSAPGLMLSGAHGQLELLGLDFSGNMQRALESFYVGQNELRLQRLAWAAPNSSRVSVQGIVLAYDSNLDGGYFDQRVNLSADRIDAAQFALTRIAYVQSLSHVHADSLAALLAEVRTAQRQPTTDRVNQRGASRSEVALLRRSLFEMAVRAPVLRIERLGFAAPEGELRLSARVAMPGVTRQELEGPAGMAAVMAHLDADADLRIDVGLLDKLLTTSGKRDFVSGTLDQLEREGYLRRDGNALTTSLLYRAGRLTINGQPFQPPGGVTSP